MPSAFPAGCVGYREDIFASKRGAECVAQFLGPSYYVSDAARSCVTDGFPYTVVPLR